MGQKKSGPFFLFISIDKADFVCYTNNTKLMKGEIG